MKFLKLLLLLFLITLYSCEKENTNDQAIFVFLDANHQLNNRRMNEARMYYQRLKLEQPNKYSSRMPESVVKTYNRLLNEIDSANQNPKVNSIYFDQEYQNFMDGISETVDGRSDYLLPKRNHLNQPEIESDKLRLLLLKNRLTLAMVYAYEYVISDDINGDVIDILEVETKTNTSKNDETIISLSCDFFYPEKRNQQILINELNHDGVESDIPYKVIDNYNFGDIKIDSLKKGRYDIKGTVYYYTRDGKMDLPFETSFEINE